MPGAQHRGRPAELVLVRNRGAATRSFPAAVGGQGRFLARVPLSDLAGAGDVADRVGRVIGDDGMAWDVYLKVAGQPRVRVAWPDGMPESRHLFGRREAVVERSRYGDLVMAERTPRPVIDEHEWQPDGRLVLRGSFLGPAGPHEMVLRRIGSSDSHVIGFRREGERFSVEADLDAHAVLRLGRPAARRRMEPVRPPGGQRPGRRWRNSSTTMTGSATSRASGWPPGASGTG